MHLRQNTMLHHAHGQWVVCFQCTVLVTQVNQDPNKIQKIAITYTMYLHREYVHRYITLHHSHHMLVAAHLFIHFTPLLQ
jgi:hypothetical protein